MQNNKIKKVAQTARLSFVVCLFLNLGFPLSAADLPTFCDLHEEAKFEKSLVASYDYFAQGEFGRAEAEMGKLEKRLKRIFRKGRKFKFTAACPLFYVPSMNQDPMNFDGKIHRFFVPDVGYYQVQIIPEHPAPGFIKREDVVSPEKEGYYQDAKGHAVKQIYLLSGKHTKKDDRNLMAIVNQDSDLFESPLTAVAEIEAETFPSHSAQDLSIRTVTFLLSLKFSSLARVP